MRKTAGAIIAAGRPPQLSTIPITVPIDMPAKTKRAELAPKQKAAGYEGAGWPAQACHRSSNCKLCPIWPENLRIAFLCIFLVTLLGRWQ